MTVSRLLPRILLLFALMTFCTGTRRALAEPVRLGWQTTWATQGQLVMALKHTNVCDLAGVHLEYLGFPYGAPLNQAALARKVDVIFTGDQPAVALMARNAGFKVVARLMYNRTCLYVPANSKVSRLSQLKGKCISGPVGAAAERIALEALRDSGINIGGITFGKLDMAQQATLVAKGEESGRWGSIDALYGFDPLPALFELNHAAKNLHCGKVVSVVMASEEMLTKRRKELEKFLLAYQLSWYQFTKTPDTLNDLFAREARLDLPRGVLDKAASFEPNMKAKRIDDFRLAFTEDDFRLIDKAVRFLSEQGITNRKFDPRSPTYLELQPLTAVLASKNASDLLSQIRFK